MAWILYVLLRRNFPRYLLSVLAVAACVAVFIISGTMGDIVYRNGMQPARLLFGGDLVVSLGITISFDGNRGEVTFGDGSRSPFFRPEQVVAGLQQLLPQASITSTNMVMFKNITSRIALIARHDKTGDRSLRPPIGDAVWDEWQESGEGVLVWDNPAVMQALAIEDDLLKGILSEYTEIDGALIVGPLPETVRLGDRWYLPESPGVSFEIPVKGVIPYDHSPSLVTHMPWVNGHDIGLLRSASDWVEWVGIGLPAGSGVTETINTVNAWLEREHPYLQAQSLEEAMNFLFTDVSRIEEISVRFRPLIWFITAITVAITQLALVNSRRKEFACYLMLGMKLPSFWLIFLGEATFIMLLGGALGLLISSRVIDMLIHTFHINMAIGIQFLAIALPVSVFVFGLFTRNLDQLVLDRSR